MAPRTTLECPHEEPRVKSRVTLSHFRGRVRPLLHCLFDCAQMRTLPTLSSTRTPGTYPLLHRLLHLAQQQPRATQSLRGAEPIYFIFGFGSIFEPQGLYTPGFVSGILLIDT